MLYVCIKTAWLISPCLISIAAADETGKRHTFLSTTRTVAIFAEAACPVGDEGDRLDESPSDQPETSTSLGSRVDLAEVIRCRTNTFYVLLVIAKT